jgi:hypothetical protein
MNPDYVLLFLALLGLWTPAAILLPATAKRKLFSNARRRKEEFGALLSSKLNWIDLLRGAGCTWLIQNSVFHFEKGQDELALVFTFVQLAIVAVAVLAQTIWFSRKTCVIGPVFFLAGATCILSGPLVGAFAIGLAIAASLMLGRLSYVFVAAPICLALFGSVFGRLGLSTIFSAGLFALPAFLAFALGVRLTFIRKKKYPERSAKAEIQQPLSTSATHNILTPSINSPAHQRAT